jgi:hypothetical protein
MAQASHMTADRVRHAAITRRILVTFLDIYNEPGTGFKERHAFNCQPPDARCRTTTSLPLRARIGNTAVLRQLAADRWPGRRDPWKPAVTRGVVPLWSVSANRAKLDGRINELAHTTDALRGEFRTELRDGLAGVRLELASVEGRLLKWSFLFWCGTMAAVAAARWAR